MLKVELLRIRCPYCGESFEIQADPSAGDQDYIEDCHICCKPIEMALRVTATGEVMIVPRRQDEA